MDILDSMHALEESASILLKESAADRFGQVSPSIYETARLVSLAPWLGGHRARIRFLLDGQDPAGLWGGNGAYRIIPTLSATEALLTVLRRDRPFADRDHGRILTAADRGLRALFGWFGVASGATLPDTVAVELLVPALVADVNQHLDDLARDPATRFAASRGGRRLVPPRALDPAPLHRLRTLVRAGTPVPEKLWHSLEIFGPAVQGAPFVRPAHGAVGCSPAATAAWLGDRVPPGSTQASVQYLTDVQDANGAVPVGAPVDVFEHAWMLAQFAGAGMSVAPPPGLLDSLHAGFGRAGASVGAGLLPDVDDTATTLYALARYGSPHPPDSLREYKTGRHFACFPAERTASPSANAHVLQALGATGHSGRSERGELASWLREQQHADGYWTDKWHASPFYATACCVAALTEADADSAESIMKAADWVLAGQRADGSWGRFQGTYEETAYAIQILIAADAVHIGQSVGRGCRFLRDWGEREHPPLWHDKDLYTPVRVVRATGLAALRLARTCPRVPAEHA